MKKLVSVRTEFNPPPSNPVENDGPVLVERGGYLPTHILVPQMLAAGRQLGNYYDELYDAVDGEVPDGYVNPLSDNEFDEIDQKTAYEQMEEKLLARKKALAADAEKAKAEKIGADAVAKHEAEKAVEDPGE